MQGGLGDPIPLGNPTAVDTRHGVKIKFTFEKRSGTHESGHLVESVDKGHDLRAWRETGKRTVIALGHEL